VDKYDAFLPLGDLEVLNSSGLAPALLPISLPISTRETIELSCCAGSSSTASFPSSLELADGGVCVDGPCGG